MPLPMHLICALNQIGTYQFSQILFTNLLQIYVAHYMYIAFISCIHISGLKKGCYVILRLFCRYYLQDIPFEQPIKTVLKMVYLEVTSFIYLCNLENVTNNTRKKGSQLKKRKGPSCYVGTVTLSCKRPKTDLKIIQKRPINNRKCQKSKYTLS